MRIIRNRAKEQMPMVLLTLLSIVQALALELAWTHINERSDLYVWGIDAFVGWLQVAVSFTGLIHIWLIYSTTVMRFRWVPSTADSAWPFGIGILEFVLINSMGPGNLTQWFIVLALLFSIMTAVIHSIMRRARRDPDNVEFFATLNPATLRDFYPNIASAGGMIMFGLYFAWDDDAAWVAIVALMLVLSTLAYQIVRGAEWWAQSVSDDPKNE